MTTRYLLAAGAFIVLTLARPGSSAGPAQAQPASALTGQVTSAEGRADGRRARQREEGRIDHHHDGRHRHSRVAIDSRDRG